MTFSHHLQTSEPEHPFAGYIRILGKGKKGARSLTQHEAYQAMNMILADQVLPVQLGAFLMLLRIKEETPEELAGFVCAIRESMAIADQTIHVDLDWSSYAGKRRHLPWFLLAAWLLAENGLTILMHGAPGPASNRLYTENMLSYLGLTPATSLEHAQKQLLQHRFSYLSLPLFCPKLHQILELRPILGLRSPVHTLVRMINPMNAAYSIQGIFHPGYRPVHQHAAVLLQQTHMAVIKGEGGETERNPDLPCLVQSVHHGELYDENWPPMFERRHLKPEHLDPKQLTLLWRGQIHDDYAEASVIGTAAIALKLLGKADSQTQAHQLALAYWSARDKRKI
jgi:anthranilate phosphoribosyltransferase